MSLSNNDYFPPNSSGQNSTNTLALAEALTPVACTVKNLYVQIATAPGAGKSDTIYVVKNGVNHLFVVLSGAGSGAGITTVNSGATTLSFSAGDAIALYEGGQSPGNTNYGFEATIP